MKFAVSRTSSWSEDNPPCPEAKRELYIRVDAQTFKSFEEHDKRFPKEPWRSIGTNHRIITFWNKESGIARDFEDKDWFVEINSLEELLDFQKKYGTVVLSNHFFSENFSLEIYDDYRE